MSLASIHDAMRRWPRWLRIATPLVLAVFLVLSWHVAGLLLPPRVVLRIDAPEGLEVLVDGKPVGNAPVEIDISLRVRRRPDFWRQALNHGAGTTTGSGQVAEAAWHFGGWEIPRVRLNLAPRKPGGSILLETGSLPSSAVFRRTARVRLSEVRLVP